MGESLLKKVAGRIRSLRESAGLTQEQLAGLSGVSQSAIARLERAEVSPSIATLELLAHALGHTATLEFERRRESAPVSSESAAATIRVLVADSQTLITQCLSVALARYPDLEVMYQKLDAETAPTGLEVAVAAVSVKPEIALIDYWMPVMDGPAITAALRSWAPGVRVLLTSWMHRTDDISRALGAGAAGFLPKSLTVEKVAEAIRRAHSGESTVFAAELMEVAGKIRQRDRESEKQHQSLLSLTPREVQVLVRLSQGQGTAEIGKTLGISKATVDRHVQGILRKFGAGSRLEAIAMARESGFIGV